MSEYTREEFAKMQEQAANHAANRQVKNQPNIQSFGNNRQQSRQNTQPKSPPPPPQPPPPKKKGKDLLELFNFKNLELDSDRIIIIALALLLSAEDADELLIMALIYIML